MQRRFIILTYAFIFVCYAIVSGIHLIIIFNFYKVGDLQYKNKLKFAAINSIQCLGFTIISSIFIFWIQTIRHRLCLLNNLLRLNGICSTLKNQIQITKINYYRRRFWIKCNNNSLIMYVNVKPASDRNKHFWSSNMINEIGSVYDGLCDLLELVNKCYSTQVCSFHTCFYTITVILFFFSKSFGTKPTFHTTYV